MGKRNSSPWWVWLLGAVVVIGFLCLMQEGPDDARKHAAPQVGSARIPITPLPDYCWYTPEGVYCDYESVEATIESMYAADMSDPDGLYYGQMEEADREATIEALIEHRWDAIGQHEAEALRRQDEGLQQDEQIEEELQWLEGDASSQEAIQSGVAEPCPGGQSASLVSVTDGDSIVVQIAGSTYRVRYIGVDTPEYGQYGFHEAANLNRQLLASGPLRLEKDVSETDQYGRLLRYVFAGGLFVNAEIVRLGYAYADTWPPDVKYSGYFIQLQREARDAERGLWAQ